MWWIFLYFRPLKVSFHTFLTQNKLSLLLRWPKMKDKGHQLLCRVEKSQLFKVCFCFSFQLFSPLFRLPLIRLTDHLFWRYFFYYITAFQSILKCSNSSFVISLIYYLLLRITLTKNELDAQKSKYSKQSNFNIADKIKNTLAG